ncbi:alpha/beta hydrolase [Schleiferilactobacillus harbinensis]|uniref:Alpha/beta hydrolase n=1 Tax=Schleiferilactobacillus harbinensis TaxID=304207 RepID=A0A5P8M378_9LACO|nr:alpha/beta hydrolase [Schleiferilactobacillus harbinensis]QFR22958.1 alpha/beta hydrolase [Schleiferilactobacillus harbinensis]
MAWWLWGLLLGAAAVLVAAAVDWWRIGHVPKHFTPIQPHLGNTPTIYIHGYSGNRYSFGHLLGRLHRAGIAQKAMVIHVKRNGQLRVQGHLLDTKNPTIQVIFCRSRAHLATELTWLHQILVLLKHNGVHRVNLVGHSMGAVLVMLAAMQLPTKDTPESIKSLPWRGRSMILNWARTLMRSWFTNGDPADHSGKHRFIIILPKKSTTCPGIFTS